MGITVLKHIHIMCLPSLIGQASRKFWRGRSSKVFEEWSPIFFFFSFGELIVNSVRLGTLVRSRGTNGSIGTDNIFSKGEC
jgi:hypothetical protein